MALSRRIAVIGTGYIGVASAIGLCELGHRVIGFDIIRERVRALNDGSAPYHEAGLDSRLRACLGTGRLTFSENLSEALAGADFIVVCVGTPSRPDGSADLGALDAVVSEMAAIGVSGSTVVLRSTVPCGTTEQLSAAFDGLAPVLYAPEFLREGHALDDFMAPARIVIGAAQRVEAAHYEALFAALNRPVIVTSYREAELIKAFSNAFLAMKISFANEVANFCDALHADALAVLSGIGADERVGKQFLVPGIGFGGPCFEKDLKSLADQAKRHDANLSLVSTTLDVNDRQAAGIADAFDTELGTVRGKRVAVWGLTFKAGTDDVRDSLSIRIVEDLIRRGAVVSAYDPAVRGAHPLIACEIATSAVDALHDADGLLILTEWPEFAAVDPAEVRANLAGDVVFDGRNVLDGPALVAWGLRYRGVGRRIESALPAASTRATAAR